MNAYPDYHFISFSFFDRVYATKPTKTSVKNSNKNEESKLNNTSQQISQKLENHLKSISHCQIQTTGVKSPSFSEQDKPHRRRFCWRERGREAVEKWETDSEGWVRDDGSRKLWSSVEGWNTEKACETKSTLNKQRGKTVIIIKRQQYPSNCCLVLKHLIWFSNI